MGGRRYYPALDVLRLLAALVIVSYHYGVEMAFLAPQSTAGPGFAALAALTGLAVNVFFLLSGASLALGYGPQVPAPDWRRYACGRVLAIYPMYWLGFGALFLYGEVLHGNNPDVPRWRVVFSLLGLDGYLSQFTVTFYKIGEWFLGVLLLCYLLFPALVWVLRRAAGRPAWYAVPAAVCALAWAWLPRAGAGIQYTHTLLWRLPAFWAGIALGSLLARRPAPGPWAAPERWRWLRTLARECYGVFLVHHVLLTLVFAPRLAFLGYWGGYALYLPLAFVLAWVLRQAARPVGRALSRLFGL